jgi:hypothetical protein
MKSTLAGDESSKVNKPPSPQAERTAPNSLKPSSPKGVQGSPGAGGALTSPTRVTPDQDPMDASSVPGPTESPEHHSRALSLMDLELSVDLNVVRAHPRHNPRRFHDNVHRSQSPYGTT